MDDESWVFVLFFALGKSLFLLKQQREAVSQRHRYEKLTVTFSRHFFIANVDIAVKLNVKNTFQNVLKKKTYLVTNCVRKYIKK